MSLNSWLLPRTVGLVHHGGFGTTAAGIRGGIPQLVIPHIADQFFWGNRVQELGIGLPAIMRTKLDTQKLAAAIESLAHADELCASAAKLAQQIQSENGVDDAVRLIEESMGQSVAIA